MSTTRLKETSITVDECLKASYDFNHSFEFVLAKDQHIMVDTIVRVLPRKRIVGFGVWQGKPVVVKLFFDKQHARRHWEADKAGMRILFLNNIPAPALLCEGHLDHQRIYVLVYERIQQAIDLYSLWEKTSDVNQLEPILEKVILELATQHVLGIRQKDLHLGNFLLTEKIVITIDGAQIEATENLLPKLESMENLALFFSQLGVGVDVLCERLYRYYAKARGWLVKPTDSMDLQLAIKKYDEQRWLHYEKKLLRSTSAHVAYHTFSAHGMLARAWDGPELRAFMQDPDRIFSQPDLVYLKKGRSSTVIQVNLDGHALVIKRYNLKHFWHRLRRACRQTRAFKGWRLAHKLRHFHVATARPVAYLERRLFGLRGRSYLVMEALPSMNLGAYCQGKTADDDSIQQMSERIAQLLSALKALHVTHGDLKKTNILINQEGYPVFIDLDGAREHATLTGLKQAWRREIKRFLANFDAQPSIKALFMSQLDAGY